MPPVGAVPPFELVSSELEPEFEQATAALAANSSQQKGATRLVKQNSDDMVFELLERHPPRG
jgi:hypothetical protein